MSIHEVPSPDMPRGQDPHLNPGDSEVSKHATPLEHGLSEQLIEGMHVNPFPEKPVGHAPHL